MIDLTKLKELIDLMKEHDLCEIDLRDGEETVAIKRPAPAAWAQQAPAPVAPTGRQAPAGPGPGSVPTGPAIDDGLEPIESPMVGTFYSASDPDSPPFVKVGDTVGPDTVVCLIEAMKVFSEVKAEKAGVIAKALVKNAEAVEFGQPLYLIRAS